VSETIFACLTPAGAGAIATLAVRGPDAWTLCRDLFTPMSGELPENPDAVTPGRFYLGQLGETMRDEAILALRRTSPPWVELHCHGGRQMLDLLREMFRSRGIRELSWSEWHHLSAASPARAAAAVQLAHATTRRSAEILLDQYHGAFDDALAAIRDCIDTGDLESARKKTDEILRYSNLGRHLVKPWKVVVAGAPNVGKSSLVNALAGFQRCVVSEVPGTTRDLVTTRIAVDGWPVELFDTAGLRPAGETLEEEGMRLTREAAAEADLCLWVLDASTPPVWPQAIAAPLLHAINKCDLPGTWNTGEAIRVSAKTGEGLSELCDAIARRVVPEPPGRGAAVPIAEECRLALEEAQRACLKASGACQRPGNSEPGR